MSNTSISRFQHYKEHDDSQPLLVPAAWLCTGRSHFFTAASSDSTPIPACCKHVLFFVVARLPWLSSPYLQVTQPRRHSYNQMLIRSHSMKSYVNAPSRAGWWWCSTKKQCCRSFVGFLLVQSHLKFVSYMDLSDEFHEVNNVLFPLIRTNQWGIKSWVHPKQKLDLSSWDLSLGNSQ